MGHTKKGNGDRRAAPAGLSLEAPLKGQAYKGKLVKQRIARNYQSNIKRKFFKAAKDSVPEQSKYLKELIDNSTPHMDSDHVGAGKADGISSNDSDDGGGRVQPSDENTSRSRNSERGTRGKGVPTHQRANPYQKALTVRDEERKQYEDVKAQREKEKRLRIKRQKKYMHDRKVKRKKLNARTGRGQPVLSNQINHFLEKIRKM